MPTEPPRTYKEWHNLQITGRKIKALVMQHLIHGPVRTADLLISATPAPFLAVDGVYHAPDNHVLIIFGNQLNMPVAYYLLPSEKLSNLTLLVKDGVNARTRQITGKVGNLATAVVADIEQGQSSLPPTVRFQQR